MKRIQEFVTDCPTCKNVINIMPYVCIALYSLQNHFLPVSSFGSSYFLEGWEGKWLPVHFVDEENQALRSEVTEAQSLGALSVPGVLMASALWPCRGYLLCVSAGSCGSVPAH